MIQHHLRHCSFFDAPSSKGKQSRLSEEHHLATRTLYSISASNTIQSYGIGSTEENAKHMRPFHTIATKEDLQDRLKLFQNNCPLTDRGYLIVCNIHRRNISL
jgi:hypothetical protein